jgi:LysM repeat protein
MVLYEVKPGDTLYGIAERFCGDSNKWREVAELNGLNSETGVIHPGDLIDLPDLVAVGDIKREVNGLGFLVVGETQKLHGLVGQLFEGLQKLHENDASQIRSLQDLSGSIQYLNDHIINLIAGGRKHAARIDDIYKRLEAIEAAQREYRADIERLRKGVEIAQEMGLDIPLRRFPDYQDGEEISLRDYDATVTNTATGQEYYLQAMTNGHSIYRTSKEVIVEVNGRIITIPREFAVIDKKRH